jgi:UDP-2,4-diacetamido-2,4,6-trideoxy-beta-L-altropyranose hydrolase
MRVLFRADSSSKIGVGHIMRDLVLAKEMIENSDEVYFATKNLIGNISHKIPYPVTFLKDGDISELLEIIKKLKIDLVVFDHYEIDWKFEFETRDRGDVKILSFDDTYEKHYCDILLNHNISGNSERYKRLDLLPHFCEIRAGKKYTLIRDEFKIEKRKKRKKENISIFIAMGGSDPQGLTLEILQLIPKGVFANVVTTSANAHLKKLKKFSFQNRWVNLHINSDRVAEIMNNSSFAIVTPSVTVHEVIYMGIPFLAIKTADNQNDIFNYLKTNRFNTLSKFTKSKFKIALKNSIFKT